MPVQCQAGRSGKVVKEVAEELKKGEPAQQIADSGRPQEVSNPHSSRQSHPELTQWRVQYGVARPHFAGMTTNLDTLRTMHR